MAIKPKVTGLKELEDNLAKEAGRMKDANARGVIKAALLVRRQSQKKTPVRLGNLRASAFVTSSALDDAQGEGGGFKGDNSGKMESDHAQAKTSGKGAAARRSRKGPVAVVGYSAAYALSVHENPRAGGGGLAEQDVAAFGEALHRKSLADEPLEDIPSTVGQWKFLQSALEENVNKILAIIKREANIDG